MLSICKKLFLLLGSHEATAEALEYSDRQYRNIRRSLEKGQHLNPRTESWLINKSKEIIAEKSSNNGRASNENS